MDLLGGSLGTGPENILQLMLILFAERFVMKYFAHIFKMICFCSFIEMIKDRSK